MFAEEYQQVQTGIIRMLEFSADAVENFFKFRDDATVERSFLLWVRNTIL